MPRIFVIVRHLCVALIIAAAAACAQGTPDTPAGNRQVTLGENLRWEPVDGAIEYRVQLWDGTRLLFEEVREQSSLAVTPVMERSMLGAESVEMQVRAIGPDGRQVGEVERRQFTAADG